MEEQVIVKDYAGAQSNFTAGLAPTLTLAGFAIFASPKRGQPQEEPLGYALHGQPYDGQLLKRGYVCMFKTELEATDALKASLQREDSSGSTWHKKSVFTIMEIHAVGANAKVRGAP